MSATNDSNAQGQADLSLAALLMDDVLMRLRTLNYEEEFCRSKDIPAFHKLQFVVPGPNVGYQYNQFVGTCVWLLQKLGATIEIDRFEDPITTMTRILKELKALNAPQEIVECPPLRLRQAHGEIVCKVLDFLTEKVLSNINHKWPTPTIIADPDDEDDYTIEQGFVDQVGASDEVMDEAIDEGESGDELFDHVPISEYGDAKDEYRAGIYRQGEIGGKPEGYILRALDSSITHDQWKGELDRVFSRLKQPVLGSGSIGVGDKGGEWRGHLESMKLSHEKIKSSIAVIIKGLGQIKSDSTSFIATITAKERYINTAFQHLIGDCTRDAELRNNLQKQLSSSQSRIATLTAELSTLIEAVEDINAQMEEKGSTMSDATPLIRLKAALANLRNESKALDLQIGILSHTCMQGRAFHRAGDNSIRYPMAL